VQAESRQGALEHGRAAGIELLGHQPAGCLDHRDLRAACAQAGGRLEAEQARAAGATACGDPAGFHGAVPATTLKVAGVDVYAGGAQGATAGQDELLWSDGRRGAYRKLVLTGDRLAGAVLVGDTTGARELSALLRSGERVPEDLLAPPGVGGGPQPEPDPAALVCSCNSVTQGEIDSAIRAGGLTTVPDVARVTRASTGCGSCAGDVERILASAEAERSAERVHRPETRV